MEWLQDNTVECACEHRYGSDESKRHGETIDAETEITCRRCFVPIAARHDEREATLRVPRGEQIAGYGRD